MYQYILTEREEHALPFGARGRPAKTKTPPEGKRPLSHMSTGRRCCLYVALRVCCKRAKRPRVRSLLTYRERSFVEGSTYRCRSLRQPRGNTAAGRSRTSPPSATACSGCDSCGPGAGGGVGRGRIVLAHMVRLALHTGCLTRTAYILCNNLQCNQCRRLSLPFCSSGGPASPCRVYVRGTRV